jgi:PHD/YefM family antitoxin component YafN of YafNO toxin-antitoxin module
MPIHTYSSREFTRNVGAAKRAATHGPVLITDRGRPAFALLKIEDYYQLAGKQEVTLLEMMDALNGGGDFAFEIPPASINLQVADLR